MTQDQTAAIKKPQFVIGVGASAGGLEALEQFFQGTKTDDRFAYVVVQHLSPNFKSLMNELLKPFTEMDLIQAEDGMDLRANTIYLIPPQTNLTIGNNHLHLTKQKKSQKINFPIDIFFESLAYEMQDKAIGVVLSGTGSDGTSGVETIKKYEGMVLVQDPETADFSGMPESAIGTSLVDEICPPVEMGVKILDYVRAEGSLTNGSETDVTILREENALSLIFALLKRKYNIDFGDYKLATMLRRIERRVHFSDTENITDYLQFLRGSSEEVDLLYRELLVEVTHFFRDQEAFKLLASETVQRVVESVEPGQQLRIWVPGCATGEEAYSLAILFYEYLVLHEIDMEVKVFATDVHQKSLDYGSRAVYPAERLAAVPQHFIDRYFIEEHGSFKVSREIRRMVIFAQHNLIQDPPFTRLNFISCRNVLIYFRPFVQRRVIEFFHFALLNNGVLFLGPSENTGDLIEEFNALNHRWRIYLKNLDRRPKLDGSFTVAQRNKQFRIEPLNRNLSLKASSRTSVWEKELLNHYVPSGILVDGNYNALNIFGDAGKYLVPPSGRVSMNVLSMVHTGLQSSIRTGLNYAEKSNESVTYRSIIIEHEGQSHNLLLTVEPIKVEESEAIFFLISILPSEVELAEGLEFKVPLDLTGEDLDQVQLLEQELHFAKENLQLTIEELETTNEELQTTNEELMASNEELQSTNEELHSVNEELYTVNSEYQLKINELTKLNNDMQNLQRSSRVRILFLDRFMRIRDFTPEMASTFNLMPHDVGRPIEHLLYNLNIDKDELTTYVKKVFEDGQPVNKEVETVDNDRFLMQLLPYQLETGTMEGVVLYMTDISGIKVLEGEMKKNQKRFQSLLNHIRRPVVYHDAKGNIIHLNSAMATILERDIAELVGKSLKSLTANGSDLAKYLEAVEENKPTPRITIQLRKEDDSLIDLTIDSQPIFDNVGNLIEYQGIGSVSA